eukprot:15436632-Alexandrium_andersonii.AAC.1
MRARGDCASAAFVMSGPFRRHACAMRSCPPLTRISALLVPSTALRPSRSPSSAAAPWSGCFPRTSSLSGFWPMTLCIATMWACPRAASPGAFRSA